MSEAASRYSEYINSPMWRKKRRQRLALDQHRCVACENREGLQVHHLSYTHFGNEPMADLVTLCDLCHGVLHQLARDGGASIDAPLHALFDKDRAEANRAANPVVDRYHQQRVEAVAQAEGQRRAERLQRHRIKESRQESPAERERAESVAAALGFELP